MLTAAGVRKMLRYIRERYTDQIEVSEIGWDVPGEAALPLAEALNDTSRIDFYAVSTLFTQGAEACQGLGFTIKACFRVQILLTGEGIGRQSRKSPPGQNTPTLKLLGTKVREART